MAETEAIRDRIRELRRVPASELRANPKNWRRHPKAQQAALRGVLAEIGYADALLARETPDGLILIDGHLRAETTPDAMVPVLILDVTEEEADKILLTLDPLAAMAQTDRDNLAALMAAVETEDGGLAAMLEQLALEQKIIAETNPADEWVGMPEFHQESAGAVRSIIVNFARPEDVEAFAKVIEQTITPKLKSIWFPQAEIQHYVTERYIADES